MRPDQRVIHIMTNAGVCSLLVTAPAGYELEKCGPGPYDPVHNYATILVRVRLKEEKEKGPA